jgi:tRNA acetyltransferase TAN1
MAGAEKRAMPDNATDQSSKRRKVRFLTTLSTRDSIFVILKICRQCQYFYILVSLTQPQGGGKWQKQQSNKAIIESGDWGVFVTCDMGREGKCIAEALDLFSQVSIMPRSVRLVAL